MARVRVNATVRMVASIAREGLYSKVTTAPSILANDYGALFLDPDLDKTRPDSTTEYNAPAPHDLTVPTDVGAVESLAALVDRNDDTYVGRVVKGQAEQLLYCVWEKPVLPVGAGNVVTYAEARFASISEVNASSALAAGGTGSTIDLYEPGTVSTYSNPGHADLVLRADLPTSNARFRPLVLADRALGLMLLSGINVIQEYDIEKLDTPPKAPPFLPDANVRPQPRDGFVHSARTSL